MPSPMFAYSPVLVSPNGHPPFQQQTFPHPTSPALPAPADWTWSGLGITTPQHLQTQPQNPDWSVMAVKGPSPVDTNRRPSRMAMLAAISPSANKKRAHETEDSITTTSNREQSKGIPNMKKQVPSPTTTSPASKRPPFPLSVPKLAKATQSTEHHGSISSSLNPFATEFVFRPPMSAPKLESVPKEFSPVHLQQSSKSLFNVFAPEFNPSRPIRNIFGNLGFSMNNATLFPNSIRHGEPSLFIKPSPSKKVIPIVPPVNREATSDAEDENNDPTQERPGDAVASPVPLTDDDIAHSNPFEKQSVQQKEDTEEFSSEEYSRDSLEQMKRAQEDPEDENISEDASVGGSPSFNGITPTRSQTKGYISKSEFSTETESDNDDSSQSNKNLTVPRSVNTNNKTPVTSGLATIEDNSPEKEFNGYPSFWEQRLLKSEQKAKRDRPLTPHGPTARNLANQLLDQEDESDDISNDKENRILPDSEEYSSDDDSVLGSRARKIVRTNLIERDGHVARVELIVKERLQPVLKGLEAVQLGIQRLSARDKEERRKEQGSDADDEDDEITVKKPNLLGIEKIKNAVVEALRQEKEQFASSVDRSAEIKDLKSVIDSLKSKLLDAEDNLDREERRRIEAERRNELLSRDLNQYERNLDLKSDQLKDCEQEIKELQKNFDQAARGWDNERHTSEKLDEVIKGIRTSLGQMTDKNSKLSNEISTLQSITLSQRDDISSLREEISKARGENGKLIRERNKLEREIEDERKRFANLQNELMETGKAIAEQETLWREELTAEKLRVQSLERNLADEERRIKKMEEECEKLAKIAEERGKLKAMVEASVARERTLEVVKEGLEKRVYIAEARESVAQEEHVRREKEKAVEYEKEKDVLRYEISSLQAIVKTLQEERTKASIIYGRERTELAVQSEKIESLGRELKLAMQNSINREKLLESSTRDLKESQSTILSLRKEITSLRDRMDKKDTQLESLREIANSARAEIVEKDKQILELEFIIASTTSPTKRPPNDESYLKLQKREKEISRLRELMSSLLRDNEDLLAQSPEILLPEQQKKYNAMKNILRAERERRKTLERDLARALAKNIREEARTPGSKSGGSIFETPATVKGGLDTPVSLNGTPASLRGFTFGEDTPLKGKGAFIE